MSTWGSKCWRIIILIFAIILITSSLYSMYVDYLAEYHTWYYHMTTLVFSLALIGLVLLVREGFLTFTNYTQYGLHPKIDASPELLESEIESEVNGAEDEI